MVLGKKYLNYPYPIGIKKMKNHCYTYLDEIKKRWYHFNIGVHPRVYE